VTTYVLVHGAWHGGWCWRKVTPLLRAPGHDVFTPTLTGLGERAHLGGPDVSLQTHIQDIVNVLHYEDLREVVLVGHSYGGMVISGVAEQVAGRIQHLVYIDAYVPADGDSLIELRRSTGAAPMQQPDGWRMPVLPGYFGVTEPNDVAWLERHLVPHPFRTMTEPIKLPQPLEAMPFKRTYIFAAGNELVRPSGAFDALVQRLQRDPAWKVETLPTGHDAMVTMPGELAAILLSLT
jgi:pimeloyl-ACP methyl ester carboxylesterase